ncbi:MAG: DEAD/DEAH box helicase family protein, partial [Acidobacteriota bacterium]|nr:DEAD/DEAH box helicase family protein [Acidobacteriota bacterium]
MPTNFAFLQAEWPFIHEAALKAEASAYPDPGTACIHARRALDIAMQWIFKTDNRLQVPYQQSLSALVHEPTFIQVAGQGLQTKARLIIEHGNRAAHDSHRTITDQHSVAAVRELFHFTYWLARTYARTAKPAPTLMFQPQFLPRTSPLPPQTRAQLAQLQESLTARDAQLAELITGKAAIIAELTAGKAAAIAELTAGKAAVDAELAQLRAEIAEARQRNEAVPDTHDYSEAQTRDEFIDLLLAEAGWDLAQTQDREYRVEGIPSPSGIGYIDYVLWGRDGKPLALVEAKRSRTHPEAGQQQAKLYADSLEKKFGQRPVIFYTNGYQHWLWDDLQYPPRQVSGFYTHDELVLLHQRRDGLRQTLTDFEVKPDIANRYYQSRAVRKVTERFELQHQRRALLVMATGAGKTRTVIALCELLMRAGWVKRVLFLADRLALVKQAANAFKTHLPSSSPVNLVSERNESSRVYLSTYPTMMGLIDEQNQDGTHRFGAGHFDLVIVDEAHRSIYRKYAAIFDYFDSFLVGLTATPKDEVDRNTYRQFVLEDGVPTDEYSLEDAIKDKFLVPPKSVSVPLKFQREGIHYSELPDEEKDQWDALEWDEEEGQTPQEVDPAALNNWLFNEDTVDKVLQHLMEKRQKVASGDRLGKTIIFAKNHDHAQFIARRFDANYPKDAGHFARVIDFQTGAYAQTLIDDFSQLDKQPHLAISVDMLDTGIDVPEVVNLVFFKVVRSKTKFWQMLGRGTRLSPNLFGPGRNKQFFYIFDFCGNLEFFSQDPETTDGSSAESLSKKLFVNRVELLDTLDTVAARNQANSDEAEAKLRTEV